MIKKIVNEVAPYLPLVIENIELRDTNLIITGQTWVFSTVSSWRLINNNKMLCGCDDIDALEILLGIKKYPIISIEPQSKHLSIDLTFIFSNGYKIEVFSTTYLEPWIFDFQSGLVYVASPSDESWVRSH